MNFGYNLALPGLRPAAGDPVGIGTGLKMINSRFLINPLMTILTGAGREG
jgi:hypothetical protein